MKKYINQNLLIILMVFCFGMAGTFTVLESYTGFQKNLNLQLEYQFVVIIFFNGLGFLLVLHAIDQIKKRLP